MYQNQSYYSQYQNPYNFAPNRQPDYQQYQPQQFNAINGKFIHTANEINVNDVPMSGSPAIFPLDDMSMIFVKNWNSDGTIRTSVFKRIEEEAKQDNKNTNEIKEMNFEPIFARLDIIEEQINKLLPKRTKKEVDAE